MGIDNADEAYELVLRRLTARITNKELVDYLQVEFEGQQDKIEDAVKDIGSQLRTLVCMLGNKSYLRRIEDVLAVHPASDLSYEMNPKWFRRAGPLAVDFENDRVCPRHEEEENLRKRVMNDRIVVLQGKPATGKSVLARKVAYQLYSEKAFGEICYFDCGEQRDVGMSDLYNEIRDVDGLVVFEDAHLANDAVSFIMSRLRGGSNLHMLLVTRPSIWDLCRERDEHLYELKSNAVTMEPHGDVD